MEFEIVLSKFWNKQDLFEKIKSLQQYDVEIGGEEDQICLQQPNMKNSIAVIWTVNVDAKGNANNYEECCKEYAYYNIKCPFEKFYSYLIETDDQNVLDDICNIFKKFDDKALLLDDKMKKFKKIV